MGGASKLKDPVRWAAYYAAFAKVHRRKSDGYEFDGRIMDIVDATLAVVRTPPREGG